jgi:hypothetical protein
LPFFSYFAFLFGGRYTHQTSKGTPFLLAWIGKRSPTPAHCLLTHSLLLPSSPSFPPPSSRRWQ